ncbi:DUF1203 domain-containing protein [Phenylobacterium sp.]|uniref:DUF1203 domain-containing protein n=1 Tax=Phenylobacterium sp. TaxID=1871053 RepID=UPI00120A8A7A|nr:DUF1203 domain-containing protein [Phenylobacterium sp.]THD59408.1 MAG: DUF1203 domain-containing protein [Phenylobacterium sp.]
MPQSQSYAVTGLPLEPFAPLFGLSDEALAAEGVVRKVVDSPTGYPSRVELEDAQVGDTVLLLNYEHQPADTPFRARHAIFVNEKARETRRTVGELPGALTARDAVSLRAFREDGMMIDADYAPRPQIEAAIARLFANPQVAYLHAHTVGWGCYLARIDRA